MSGCSRLVSLVQIHDDPPIFCTPSGKDLEHCFLSSAERAKGRNFYVLVVSCWHLPVIVDEFISLSRIAAALHPNGRLVIMCPSRADVEFVKSKGLSGLHAHHNAFIDERLFYPTRGIRDLDAIHVANPEPWKRHPLAWGVPRIAVVSYNHSGDPNRTEWPELTGYHDAAFSNLNPDGTFRWVGSEELCELYNRAHVGLILSAVEGGNFASGEYRFSGLPVISTVSEGGRADFFDLTSSFIVSPEASCVEQAVRQVIARGFDPHEIRKRAIEAAIEHRERLLAWMTEVTGENIGARANSHAWLPTFCDKFRNYRVISESSGPNELGAALNHAAASYVTLPRSTSMPIRDTDLFRKTPETHRRDTDDGCVFWDRKNDEFHHLNSTGTLVLDCCDGTNSIADIANFLMRVYSLDAPPREEVRNCLEGLFRKGLISRGTFADTVRKRLFLSSSLQDSGSDRSAGAGDGND